MIFPQRTYNELITFGDYNSRLRYLRCFQHVGDTTFGENRYFNQKFYKSTEWKRAKRDAIARDYGCDLGIAELPINDCIIVHHINPITLDDIRFGNPLLVDLNNLVCCSMETHNLIHFGNPKKQTEYIERTPFDTCPWR